MRTLILLSFFVTSNVGEKTSKDVFYLGKNFPNSGYNNMNTENIEVQITKSKTSTVGEVNGEVYEGDTIEVTCYSLPNEKLVDQDLVLQNGDITRKLKHSSSIVDSRTVTKYSVVATVSGSGVYTCFFHPGQPQMAKQLVNVIRTQPPSIKNNDRMNRTLELGSRAEYLECDVEEGVPPPTYVWQTDSGLFGSGSRFFPIENVKSSDQGEYLCSAYNRAGTTHFTVDVKVIAVRSASKPLIEKLLQNPILIVVIIGGIMVYSGLIGYCVYQKLTSRYSKIKNDGELSAIMKLPPNIRINIENLTIGELLGQGNFAIVNAGVLKINKKLPPMNVAIKSPKTTEDIQDIQVNMIIEEYEIMKGIRLHPNILTLIGGVYSLEQNPTVIKIVSEMCELGSLLGYLRKPKFDLEGNKIMNNVEKFQEYLSFAYQVAHGMEYLSRVPCVHRDLAARNVLLKSNKICRIADFGLTRIYTDKDYYRSQSETPVPIRWLSIESITEKKYDEKSDVWSFGIVLFEIYSDGKVPYPNISNENVFQHMRDGKINDKPNNCPPMIYEWMKKCWQKDPKKRPGFIECVKFFEKCFKSNFPNKFSELQELIQFESDRQQQMNFSPDQ